MRLVPGAPLGLKPDRWECMVNTIGSENAVKAETAEFFNWEMNKPWMMAIGRGGMPAVKMGRPMAPAASSREPSQRFLHPD
jgi:hypothetical protein